jgi:hypothetical protein
MSAEVEKVISNSNLLILDRYNHLGVDSICVIEYIQSWEKVDVDNVLFLVAIYKFGLGVDGHSARRLAGHLLKYPALRAGGRALSKARGLKIPGPAQPDSNTWWDF